MQARIQGRCVTGVVTRPEIMPLNLFRLIVIFENFSVCKNKSDVNDQRRNTEPGTGENNFKTVTGTKHVRRPSSVVNYALAMCYYSFMRREFLYSEQLDPPAPPPPVLHIKSVHVRSTNTRVTWTAVYTEDAWAS